MKIIPVRLATEPMTRQVEVGAAEGVGRREPPGASASGMTMPSR